MAELGAQNDAGGFEDVGAIEDIFDDIPQSPWDMALPDDEVTAQWLALAETREEQVADDRPATEMEIDYDDPVSQHLVKVLRRHVRDACNVNSHDEARARAMEWIFVPGREDADRLDFEHICVALGARPTVVRLRTVLQLWKAGVVLTQPLSVLATGLPVELESEIAAKVGFDLPVRVSRLIWSWPSILAMDVVDRFPGENVAPVLRALDAEGLIAAAHMRLYFVGRNPDILPIHVLRRFSFARSIHVSY